MPKVYVGGTFDLPHHGHYRLLQKASDFGQVTVALNSDEFISTYKGRPPIMTFEERKEVLLSCKWVSEIIENFGDSDSKPAIDKVAPDFIVAGSDWAKLDYYSQMGFDQSWLDARNIGLIFLPYTKGISTTDLRQRIADTI